MRRTALMFVLAGLVGALVATPVAVYASHQFTDVPNTNPFHADIDWLSDTGVTKGCGSNIYCPKDNVTREQMAAFMRRLSGNDPNVAPSVDADQLDGYGAQQLAPRAAFNSTNDVELRAGNTNYNLSTEITAPAPGILLITGGVEASNPIEIESYGCRLRVDGNTVTGSDMFSQLNGDSNVNEGEDCTTSGAVVVNGPGTHSIDLELSAVAASTELGGASVWAIWVPFDGNGNTPTVP